MKKKCIVISAINITEGGPLTILLECVEAASSFFGEDWVIYALINNLTLINNSRIKTIEYSKSKKSWITRLKTEWLDFNALSKQLQPDLWLSLHDITPNITALRQVVYCHNASPFYKVSLKEASLDPKFLLFNWFYKYLYKINIHRNFAIVVQQNWLRVEFQRLFNHQNIIVAHPIQHEKIKLPMSNHHLKSSNSQKKIFIYPTLPRVFKNIEILCYAAQLLADNVQDAIEIRITINGTENKYAQKLFNQFKHVKCLNFIGRQNKKDMELHYQQSDVLLFPSKLESWGLPLSEAKFFGKSILVADLPYAHEAIGTYDDVSFINHNNADDWASAITNVVSGEILYMGANTLLPNTPYASDWHSLWKQLSKDL
jgi:glycosyltransferase involved in cell wall biosynthesis